MEPSSPSPFLGTPPAASPTSCAPRTARCCSPATPATRAGDGSTTSSRAPSRPIARATWRAWHLCAPCRPGIRVLTCASATSGEDRRTAGRDRGGPAGASDSEPRSVRSKDEVDQQLLLAAQKLGREAPLLEMAAVTVADVAGGPVGAQDLHQLDGTVGADLERGTELERRGAGRGGGAV